MPSLRDKDAREQLVQRLRKLTPASNPKWGKLDAPRVLCHLSDTLSVALGEASAQPLNRKLLHRSPVKHLIMYVFPFPKGAPTSPDLLLTPPGDFDADRQLVLDLMARLAAAPRGQGPENPIFGPMTNDEWNALQWKHIDHHLKQFGC
jgi:hypothetical protein